MPDYSKGKIYAIKSYQCDDIYIGSTVNKLSDRLSYHKTHYKSFLCSSIAGSQTHAQRYQNALRIILLLRSDFYKLKFPIPVIYVQL